MLPEEIQQAITRLSASDQNALFNRLATRRAVERKNGRTAPSVPSSRRPVKLSAAVLWTLVSLCGYALVEGAVFHSGWYCKFLAPNSTAGQTELHVGWVTASQPVARPEVLAVGDSRIAEGFSARAAGAAVNDKIRFWNEGIGGTSPRVWFYLLRDMDPTRRRFAAIVLPLDHYSDQDGDEDLAARDSDLNYLIGRLRISDCADFANSVPDRKLWLHIVSGCALKGMTLRPDVIDLLHHPGPRAESAKDWREHGAGYVDGYEGKAENVSGIAADWVNRRISFPAGLNDAQRTTIQATVMPRTAPQAGRLTEYRKLWFGRILDLYKNSSTALIFIEIPRAPLPRPDYPVAAAFIDSVASRPDVRVIPKETFRDLERPELFADGLHLNHVGRPLFSAHLASVVSNALGGG